MFTEDIKLFSLQNGWQTWKSKTFIRCRVKATISWRGEVITKFLTQCFLSQWRRFGLRGSPGFHAWLLGWSRLHGWDCGLVCILNGDRRRWVHNKMNQLIYCMLVQCSKFWTARTWPCRHSKSRTTRHTNNSSFIINNKIRGGAIGYILFVCFVEHVES